MRFLKSFKYAFRGIVYCINNERNMRIHTVAMLYVFVFSFFFEVSRTGYAVLFLTFSSVIAAEIFNTVAEELSDMAAASFHPVVRIVKDMAAGAVLVCALFAVIVGISIFWQPAAFMKTVSFFTSNPLLFLPLLLSVFLSVAFVVLGPLGIRDIIRKKRDK